MQFASSLQKMFYFDARFNYESKGNNEEINYVKPTLISNWINESEKRRGTFLEACLRAFQIRV